MTTTPEPEDRGHLLPEEEWLAVVAGAEDRARQLQEPPDPSRRAAVDRTILARSHGGTMRPRLGVIHSAETPLRAGYAYSIAANWFATKATTSATVMIDPAETIRLLPDTTVSYAVGPKANGFTVNVEQAGYARFDRATWLTPDGRAQAARVADYMRDCRRNLGIPLRWATDAQIRAAAAGGEPQGWCTHDDVRRVLGGTTHTDPGGGYPRDVLMALALDGQPPMQEDEDMDPNVVRVIQETANGVGALIGVAARPLEAEQRLATLIRANAAATTEQLRQLAERQGQPFDLEAVRAIVEQGVAAGISSIDVDATVRFGAAAGDTLPVIGERLTEALEALRVSQAG